MIIKYEKKQFLTRVAFVLPAFIMFSALVILPFLMGVYYSFTDWDGISVSKFIGLDNFTRLFQDSNFIKAGMNTFILCIINIVLSNPLAILIAMLLNKPLRFRGTLRAAFYMPNVLSYIVISVLWTLILRYEGVLNAILDVIGLGGLKMDWIGDMSTALPSIIFITIWVSTGTSIIIYLAGLNSIPGELYESAMVDGVNAWSKIRHITFPLLMPSITICTFLGLTANLKMFDIPYIMTQGGPAYSTSTIALVIYDYAFKGMLYGYATAAGIVFLVLILIISLFQLNITRKREVEY